MAVTQYIGARYVPVFADPVDWNNTRTYEPLTIVLYQGDSYTSAQYVPKGIDITNEDFWKRTGSYNAQVEQYRKDVTTFRGYVDSAVDKMETDLSKVDSKITASVQPAIDTIELNYNKCYDTVADMQADTEIQNGMIVKTLGFYSIGDYGGAFYKIYDNLTANNLDIIKCQNSLQAKIVIGSSLCINALGAKGDESNDTYTRITNMNAFARAFELCNNIECQPKGVYFFPIDKSVNCRSTVNAFNFDGKFSNLADFSVEFALASDSYDWGRGFNWHTSVIRNVNFGIGYDKVDNKSMTPCIISGMGLTIENVLMYNKYVLLAYVDRPIDHLRVTNVAGVNTADTGITVIDYNLIMCISKDGTLKKETSTGDGWSFNQIREIYSKYADADNNKYYGLIKVLHSSSITFNDCVQILVQVGLYAQTQFNSCHYESDNTGVILSSNNTLVIISFVDCSFYQSVKIPINKKCAYIGCMFYSRGADKNKIIGKSLINTCSITNCLLENTYRIISNTDADRGKIGCNYVYWGINSFKAKLNKRADSYGGFSGESKVTGFVRFVESNVYRAKIEETFNTDTPYSFSLAVENSGDAILDLYIENEGKIYHSQCRFYGNFYGFRLHVGKAESDAEYGKRDDNVNAYCYPFADTTEIVDSIPDYTERATAYQIASNVVLDTSDSTAIYGCAMLAKSVIPN